ncbi:MAG: HlyC/CorC family transporter [candidate division Zixibacteria bacterium]|nr:HlyC/CorC family transporter [candidate division Zixibacteria bacterium]
MLLDLTLILLLVVANGFFVAAEFALVKVRLSEIETLAQKGRKTAQMAQRILLHLDTYLSACQLGITLASLGLGWVGEPYVAKMLEPVMLRFGVSEEMVHYIAFPIAFTFITFLHITVGEQVPKMLAIQKSLPSSLAVGLPLMAFRRVFQPFIWFLNMSSNLMVKAIGVAPVAEYGETATETELRLILVNAAAGGHVTRRERLIMENVLDLEGKPARRYMVPRRQIVYIDRHAQVEETLRTVADSGHTRFPLCEESLDRIIGLVHVKDVFRALQKKDGIASLESVAREALFLPETIKLDVLLLEFQRSKTALAVLVDEYGVVSGMITIDNVVEELVGPIQDEFDTELPQIIRKSETRFEVEASCPVDMAVKGCELELPKDTKSDTLGGVVVELLGHIPVEGEQVVIGAHTLTVLWAEPTRIRRLLVERILPPENGTEIPTEPV